MHGSIPAVTIPPRAIPPGFVFFLQECSKFPTPGHRNIVLLKKKINYLPSKIGFQPFANKFANFPEKAS
jgi:hypothetical protein